MMARFAVEMKVPELPRYNCVYCMFHFLAKILVAFVDH